VSELLIVRQILVMRVYPQELPGLGYQSWNSRLSFLIPDWSLHCSQERPLTPGTQSLSDLPVLLSQQLSQQLPPGDRLPRELPLRQQGLGCEERTPRSHPTVSAELSASGSGGVLLLLLVASQVWRETQCQS